ncbi:EF-hand domain-containing protein [Rosistilla oblonga]|uniref:EF-hand domain-containing protein n=1 Tax=Rosistilla oblonga TaxID=2527990 RepID=UPI003A96BDE5
MNSTLRLIAISGILTYASTVSAQPPGRGGPPGGSPMEMISQLFDRADTNRDGSVTKQELSVVMQAMQSMRGGRQGGPGGPPPQGGPGAGEMTQPRPEHGGQHGPPPRPGQVIPDFVVQSLSLTDRQSKQLTALQTTVDKRLAAILTDEQMAALQQPPQGPQGHGAPGEEEGDRPRRPQ